MLKTGFQSISIALSAALFMSACQNSGSTNKNKAPKLEQKAEKTRDYLAEGTKVTQATQAALLSEVSSAMQRGGTTEAIAYCNVEAMPLTDSLSQHYQLSIQRIAMRNRNPENHLASAQDSAVWDKYRRKLENEQRPEAMVVKDGGRHYFYKPIILGMETCLKCHGEPGQEVSQATQMALDSLYPADRALHFEIGDLRGMWKISFDDQG